MVSNLYSGALQSILWWGFQNLDSWHVIARPAALYFNLYFTLGYLLCLDNSYRFARISTRLLAGMHGGATRSDWFNHALVTQWRALRGLQVLYRECFIKMV